MTLPTSGTITAADINVELGRPIHNPLNLNDPEARALAGVPSGRIRYSDFYGKTNDPFISEGWYDSNQALNLSPECTKIYFEIVAGGAGGAGGAMYDRGGHNDYDGGCGGGGGGAGQFKTGYINVTNRNLYLVIGGGGNGGAHGNAGNRVGSPGGNGGNTDIRVGSASGTVLAWAQGGYGGKPSDASAWGGVSGSGGNDGDGNAGGAGVGVGPINSNTFGNDGAGGAGGSGSNYTYTDQGYDGLARYSSKGGNGGRAGNNGGGRDMAQGNGTYGLQSCGGGGGKSASPWGGNGGRGGAASRRNMPGDTWMYYNADNATGYGNGGGGGCKNIYPDGYGNGGSGSKGRVYIKQLRK